MAPIIKPMITNQTVLLTPREQMTVSGWLVKLGALMSFRGEDESDSEEKETSASLLRWMLAHDGRPPLQSSVRIAAIDMQPRHKSVGRPGGPFAAFANLLPDQDGIPDHIFYAVGVSTYLVYEVVVGEPEVIKEFCGRTQDDDWFIRIFPPSPNIKAWPPPRTLDGLQINLLKGVLGKRRAPKAATLDLQWRD